MINQFTDYVCVWIEDGFVYAGIKRVYDFYDNTGFIVHNYGTFDEVDEFRENAIVHAAEVAQSAGLPFKMKWRENK